MSINQRLAGKQAVITGGGAGLGFAIAEFASIEDATLESWQRTLTVKVACAFICTQAALFLATDEARFVSGSVLTVDGLTAI